MEEILVEMAESDATEEQLAGWLTQFGKILAWCGSGDDAMLPPEVRDFLRMNRPELLQLLPAGENQRELPWLPMT
jgi:hypothetical protein